MDSCQRITIWSLVYNGFPGHFYPGFFYIFFLFLFSFCDMVARTLFTSICSLFNLIDVYEKQLFSLIISFA